MARLVIYPVGVIQSEDVKNPVLKVLVKEGRNLPNSVTENIGGFSLAPTYSPKKLNTIRRRKLNKEYRRCSTATETDVQW